MTNNMTSHSTSMRQASLREIGKRGVLATLALVTASLPAHAHPGHAWSQASTTHVLTSPDHLAVLALAGFAICLTGCFIHRRVPRRVLQLSGMAAFATAAVLWGFGA
jgi:hypothetical protein